MISILTITLGRTLYLDRLMKSIAEFGGDRSNIVEHFIVSQGNGHSDDFLNKLENDYENTMVVKTDHVSSVGKVLTQILPMLVGDTVFKLDDDAVLRSPNFFPTISNIKNLVGDSVFSPFPVGLINNLGGPRSDDRRVVYSEVDDTYYTLRKVSHVGGFARIAPKSHLMNTVFSDGHNEDAEFSNNCNANGVDMFYLENGLIVEHQESTLGQHARYDKVNYFKNRF